MSDNLKLDPNDVAQLQQVEISKLLISQLLKQLEIQPTCGILGMLELISYIASRLKHNKTDYDNYIKLIMDELKFTADRTYDVHLQIGAQTDLMRQMQPNAQGPVNFRIIHASSQADFNQQVKEELEKIADNPELVPTNAPVNLADYKKKLN